MTSTLLTVNEAAGALRVHPRTVTRWIEAGRLKAITLPNGRYRLTRDVVDAVLTPTENAPPP